jgi:apolipoprotein N-acyltransferase
VKALEQARKALPILASVLMLSLAFPPADVSLMVLVALAPWFATLRDTDARGAKRSGYLFGLLYFLFQMYWLVPFVARWTGSYVLAAVPWIAAASIAGLYYLGAAWLVNRCWRFGAVWMVPLVWAGVEGFRSYVVGLAFPWGIVGEPLWRFPMFVQHAAWGTVFLVSATVVALNVALASLVWPNKERSDTRQAIAVTAVALLLTALSVVRYLAPPEGKIHRYSIAQMGVDEAFGDEATADEQKKHAVDVVMALSIAGGAETIVFPEGIADPSPTVPPLGPVQPVDGPALLFGGNRVVGEDVFQTAYAYDGQWHSADKTRLVIFGEYVPFRDQLPFLQSFQLPSGDLAAAEKLETLEVKGVKTGQLLCFEGMFPDLAERHCRNGAQVLAVMAIDDWYVGTPAHAQLTSSSVWRSIESGLPLVRATSLGTSLYTNSRGKVVAMAEFGRTAALPAEVAVSEGSDAFGYRFAFVWACWLAIAWVYLAHFRRLSV